MTQKAKTMPKSFITDELVVKWSNLLKPDTHFGTPGDHNVTVLLDKTLQKEIKGWQKSVGAKKVNGISETTEGEETLKVKSKLYTTGDNTRTSFPCYDVDARETDDVPFGGDTVKLRIAPRVNDRDNSLSLWLSGVQIVKSGGRTTGFTPINGFTAESNKESDEDTLPF